MAGGWRDDENGVVGGSPADLFENSLVDEAMPFRKTTIAGPGRPKGSPNKRTLDMRELYLKSGFPHPLLWQGWMLKQGIDGLSMLLGCELLEAAELLRKIAADAAPFLESKMPTKIEAKDDKLPVLVVLNQGDAAQQVHEARQDGTMGIDDDLANAVITYQQDQQVSAAVDEASHAEASHVQGEAAD